MSAIGRRLLRVKNYGLTPQEQSSERNLQGKIVPWKDIFDNDVMIPKEIFENF